MTPNELSRQLLTLAVAGQYLQAQAKLDEATKSADKSIAEAEKQIADAQEIKAMVATHGPIIEKKLPAR